MLADDGHDAEFVYHMMATMLQLYHHNIEMAIVVLMHVMAMMLSLLGR